MLKKNKKSAEPLVADLCNPQLRDMGLDYLPETPR